MKCVLAQLNPVIGDVRGGVTRIKEILSSYGGEADLVIFPELFLVGYPPRDILEKPGFIESTQAAVRELTALSSEYPDTGILVGLPTPTGMKTGKGLHNSAVLIYRGDIAGTAHKSHLPSYDVFDETRYFDPAATCDIISFKGEKLGVTICEDMWHEQGVWPGRLYAFDPVEGLIKKGATVLINMSASPFYDGKEETRMSLIRKHAVRHKKPFLFVNQVGGNDELVFDGRSICVDPAGEATSVFPSFREHVEMVDTSALGKPDLYVPQERVEALHDALVLGIRDYMRKCGFKKAVLGISGGIDSAVTCALAAEAIGGDNVLGISMPSPYSAKESTEYSLDLARNLGVELKEIPISEMYNAYLGSLGDELGITEGEVDVSLQNVQARIRGNILMAFSNRFGHMLLTTGNKSELAVGYCTLYGDMAGGLAAISDVPKTMVYRLAGYINREKEIIPTSIIKRAPSAELKPDQLDQDTLPPYDILDSILYRYMEEGYSAEKLAKNGFDPATVKWVINAVDRNEYKRRQAPPGLKVTTKAFGIGRRMPIAARYEQL